MSLMTPINFIAQKLLYLWIKPHITLPDELQRDDNSLIIYVVGSRAWSDLLVLEHECKRLNITRPLARINHEKLKQWHNIHTLAHAQPVRAWFSKSSKHSTMLDGIYRVLTDPNLTNNASTYHPEFDIQFVPVVIFWGRPVTKQKHWLRVLFSETWGFAGRSRRFFTILFNGKNTLVQFSPAISYRELINESAQQESNKDGSNKYDSDKPGRDRHGKVIQHTQNKLSQRLTKIRSATLGPDISHRRTLVKSLLENKAIIAAINQRSREDNISQHEATKIAFNYLHEIVADRSYITIQMLQRILTAFWNKFYSGINVHFSETLKPLALSHELIYVPCHRSHIDYLLLSYVIHQEGLAIPYIAAGKNLNMPVIGSVLRNSGAFFIRRSFKGNVLYSTVMFEYMASQISSGMPIEYFIEGGRSRTGRLLQPKPGMLAMSIRSFLKYQKRPIAFIPVYIGYEKMIEGKAYLAELAGDDKKSETLFSSIRSFFNIRGFYGRVTTNFGQAILLNDILNRHDTDWKNQQYHEQPRPEWFKPCVTEVSQLIMQGINECCDVNAVNLIATALLAAPNQTMDEGELKRTLSFYIELIKDLTYSDRITLTTKNAAEQIQHSETLGLVKRRKHEMGDFIYLDAKHAILLTYYRNNILHLMVLPSIIASCFNNTHSLERDKIKYYLKLIYPFLKTEFFLPWQPAQLDDIIDKTLQRLTTAELLKQNCNTGILGKPDICSAQYAQLTTLAQVISPLLELYYMIFALLAEHGSNTLSRDRLEQLCHLMAQRLSLMYDINSPDFFDKKLIANFINALINLGYVEINSMDKLELTDLAAREGRHARRLIDKSMQYNILQMLKSVGSK